MPKQGLGMLLFRDMLGRRQCRDSVDGNPGQDSCHNRLCWGACSVALERGKEWHSRNFRCVNFLGVMSLGQIRSTLVHVVHHFTWVSTTQSEASVRCFLSVSFFLLVRQAATLWSFENGHVQESRMLASNGSYFGTSLIMGRIRTTPRAPTIQEQGRMEEREKADDAAAVIAWAEDQNSLVLKPKTWQRISASASVIYKNALSVLAIKKEGWSELQNRNTCKIQPDSGPPQNIRCTLLQQVKRG